MREKTNLTIHGDVKALGQRLADKRKLSLSEFVERLISEEATRQSGASFEKQLAEIRAEIAALKKKNR